MAGPAKLNLKIYQGNTFRETLRQGTSLKGYANVTGITKTAPVQIIAPGATLPAGWRFQVTNVAGMKEINCTEDSYYTATTVSAGTITVNAVNAAGYSTYTSGGVVSWAVPKSLAGVTARMQIRSKITDDTVIKELTTANGGILIDDTAKTITIYMSATDTAALSFSSAVYSLELVEGSDVTTIVAGSITLEKEVTR